MTQSSITRFTLAFLLSIAAAEASPAGDAQTPEREAPITRSIGDALQWGPCPAIFPSGCEIAVLHGDPAKPNADVFLKVAGGKALPAHTHTSAERMVLVSGQLDVKYEGAALTTLTPGEYAYGPAKLPHQATCKSSAPCVLFIAFEGPVDALAHAGLDD
jgi:quercetin dioxygenase-like cupin family protein